MTGRGTTPGFLTVPAGYAGDLVVAVGPRLLSGIEAGPSLSAHRRTWLPPARLDAAELVNRTRRTEIRGRGGAGFPFSRKLSTAHESGRKRSVIVNAAEGEPGSAKDSALLITAPHLVLDGAELVAVALESPTVRVVVPPERPAVEKALQAAIAERGEDPVRYTVLRAGGSFVGGQARAVIELAEGRDNLPVTAWAPEAVSGIKGRPTLLANAETFAQVAAVGALGVAEYLRAGNSDEPGTTLLTVAGDGPGGVVVEVPFGVRLAEVLTRCGYRADGVVLIGGYHGSWLTPDQVRERLVSRLDLSTAGASIGAGVVLPLDPAACPVATTAQIVAYLAAHSARRCGPCRNGLPALAASLEALAGGDRAATGRVKELLALVSGRGACAHPDGTARLVRSLLAVFPDEVRRHEAGGCSLGRAVPLAAR